MATYTKFLPMVHIQAASGEYNKKLSFHYGRPETVCSPAIKMLYKRKYQSFGESLPELEANLIRHWTRVLLEPHFGFATLRPLSGFRFGFRAQREHATFLNAPVLAQVVNFLFSVWFVWPTINDGLTKLS